MAINAKIPPVGEQSFGNPPAQYNQQWFSVFTGQLMRRMSLLSGPNDPVREFMMQSPDNRVWRVTISNSGVMTPVLVNVSDEATRKEKPPI